MTTIATDGKVMAADGLVCDHDTIVQLDAMKIFKCADGSVLGVSGRLEDGEIFRAWYDRQEKATPDVWEQSEALLLKADGTVWWITARGDRTRAPSIAALGSGMDFALAAMDAGAAPHVAVRIAGARDPRTGGNTWVRAPRQRSTLP